VVASSAASDEDSPRIKLLRKRLRKLKFKRSKTTTDLIGIEALQAEITKEKKSSRGGGGLAITKRYI